MFSPDQVPTEIEQILDCGIGGDESLACLIDLRLMPRSLTLVAS